jgi:DNA polymerase I-like protein with 3'-5' exonuclease and polymerase domains
MAPTPQTRVTSSSSKSWKRKPSPVAKLVKAEMEGVADLAVPLVVEVGWGKSWYEAKA